MHLFKNNEWFKLSMKIGSLNIRIGNIEPLETSYIGVFDEYMVINVSDEELIWKYEQNVGHSDFGLTGPALAMYQKKRRNFYYDFCQHLLRKYNHDPAQIKGVINLAKENRKFDLVKGRIVSR
ncbi:hypothetical protein [Streptomyces fungicidicus]|uniref:hypothetical protein n=1 Tax=Streptomyces fungicidicus TaxID=68203 RepID=UPI0033E4D214